MKFLSNLEIKEQYKKGSEENPRTLQKIKKKQVSEISRTERKIVIRLRIFQWHHPVKLLMKNRLYVKHVISFFIKVKFHVK